MCRVSELEGININTYGVFALARNMLSYVSMKPRSVSDALRIINKIDRKGEELTESLSSVIQKRKDKRIIELNRDARIKYAKSIGLKPDESIEKNLRKALNERIILEIKSKKITHKIRHKDISICIGSSRPNITAIMNRRIKGVTTDMMIKILCVLSVEMEINFPKGIDINT